MRAWRLCRAAFVDLSGDGARLHGGRWNSPGRPMIYAAETAALAVLEVRVHLDLPLELLPDDYVLAGMDLGDPVVETLEAFPDDPRAFGDSWLAEGRSAVLRVPSVIVPESRNFLLNPAHPQAGGFQIAATRPFAFDPRLWR